MSNSVSSSAPTSVPRPADAVLDRLLFLARYHGRSLDAEQLTGGVPLPYGRVTVDELQECAGHAGADAGTADEVVDVASLDRVRRGRRGGGAAP